MSDSAYTGLCQAHGDNYRTGKGSAEVKASAPVATHWRVIETGSTRRQYVCKSCLDEGLRSLTSVFPCIGSQGEL
jgi:hypothetical protein